MAFMCRPFSATTSVIAGRVITKDSVLTTNITPVIDLLPNGSAPVNSSNKLEFDFFYAHETCHLWHYFDFGYQGYVRLLSEAFVIVSIFIQIALIANEVWYVGRKKWWQVLVSKTMF